MTVDDKNKENKRAKLFDIWTMQEYKFKNMHQLVKFVQSQNFEKKVYPATFYNMAFWPRKQDGVQSKYIHFSMNRYQARYEDDPFDITYEDVLEQISKAGSSIVFRNTQTQEVFYSNESKKMLKFIKSRLLSLTILKYKALNGQRTLPNDPWEFRFTMDPFGWDQPPQLKEKVA